MTAKTNNISERCVMSMRNTIEEIFMKYNEQVDSKNFKETKEKLQLKIKCDHGSIKKFEDCIPLNKKIFERIYRYISDVFYKMYSDEYMKGYFEFKYQFSIFINDQQIKQHIIRVARKDQLITGEKKMICMQKISQGNGGMELSDKYYSIRAHHYGERLREYVLGHDCHFGIAVDYELDEVKRKDIKSFSLNIERFRKNFFISLNSDVSDNIDEIFMNIDFEKVHQDLIQKLITDKCTIFYNNYTYWKKSSGDIPGTDEIRICYDPHLINVFIFGLKHNNHTIQFCGGQIPPSCSDELFSQKYSDLQKKQILVGDQPIEEYWKQLEEYY